MIRNENERNLNTNSKRNSRIRSLRFEKNEKVQGSGIQRNKYNGIFPNIPSTVISRLLS